MSICPHCQAENEAGATVCRACGKPLATATTDSALPLWLQALNPEGRAEDTVVAQAHTATPIDATTASVAEEQAPDSAADATTQGAVAHPANEHAVQATNEQSAQARGVVPPATEADETDAVVAEAHRAAHSPPVSPVEVQEEAPPLAMPTSPASGTDTVIATQPTAAARPGGPPPPAVSTSETASLINEDDLPAWLRAFSEAEGAGKAATDDDQSWMLGDSTTVADEQATSDLAQSWQAPPRATAVERTSASAIFTAPAASPANVARHERLIAPIAPPPAVKQPVVTSSPTAGAAGGVPVRLGAGRPIPDTQARRTSAAQRIAVIVFLAALVIFLVVLAIFVVAPALRG